MLNNYRFPFNQHLFNPFIINKQIIIVHDTTLPLYGSRIYKNIIRMRINCMKRYAAFPRTTISSGKMKRMKFVR